MQIPAIDRKIKSDVLHGKAVFQLLGNELG